MGNLVRQANKRFFCVKLVETWKSSATGLQIEPKVRRVKVPILYLEHLVLGFMDTVTY